MDFFKTDAALRKRGLSLDEWTMILNFCTEVKPDLSNFDVCNPHADPRLHLRPSPWPEADWMLPTEQRATARIRIAVPAPNAAPTVSPLALEL